MGLNEINFFCEEKQITLDQFYGRELYNNDLHITCKELPKGFSPNVVGDLSLNLITKIPKGFRPTVGGSLKLPSVIRLPEEFKPNVFGSLHLNDLNKLPSEFNLTVGAI